MDMTFSRLNYKFEQMKHFGSLFWFLLDASKLNKLKDGELHKFLNRRKDEQPTLD